MFFHKKNDICGAFKAGYLKSSIREGQCRSIHRQHWHLFPCTEIQLLTGKWVSESLKVDPRQQ